MRVVGWVIAAGMTALLSAGCDSSTANDRSVITTAEQEAEECTAAAVSLGYEEPVVLLIADLDVIGRQCSVQVSTGTVVQIVLPDDGSAPVTLGEP